MNAQPATRTKRGAARRAQILEFAEKVIGEKGFSAASIADITRAAGTAQGTFYIYFSSKEEVFRELVLEMGRLTRAMMSEAVAGADDRMASEEAGLRAFLEFVAARPTLYRIVEEARFVDPEAYQAYFSEFGKAYTVQLEAAQANGELKPGDAEVRAWMLMGIAKTLGDRFVLWDNEPDIDRVVDEAMSMIAHGMRP